MAVILALDTSSITASVAFYENGRILFQAQLNTGLTHSEQLMPMVEAGFSLIQRDVREVDCVAVTQGPGSFTGLRIGISTAKGLAQGRKVPLVAVPTLDVLAENGRHWRGKICPIMNARRGEVYCAVYQGQAGGILRLSEYQAMPLTDFLHALHGDEPVLFVGDALDVLSDELSQHLKAPFECFTGIDRYVRADRLAYLAENILASSRHSNDLHIEPLYIRQSEAVIRWEEAHPGEYLDV